MTSFLHQSRMSMIMGNNEVQKVDQETTIKHKIPSISTELNSGLIGFKVPPAVGAGMDERFNMFPTDQQLSIESDKLSNVETSFYKQSLLMDITSSDISSLEKIERVRHGSIVGILPNELVSGVEIDTKTLTFHAGGLFNDWSYSME